MNTLSAFPESFWIPANSLMETYLRRIDYGYVIAENSSVCILSLMRDCEKIVPFQLSRLEHIGSFFKKSDIFIYENDSSDKTAELLTNWHQSNKGRFVATRTYNHERCKQDTSLLRRQRMSFYRNTYLKYLNLDLYDYVIICDEPIGGFSYYGILNSLGAITIDWAVVGSNSLYYDNHNGVARRLYFDSWAFDFLGEDKGPEYTKEWQEKINSMSYERGQELIEVNSCFGGLAIYKSHWLHNMSYDESNCDHKTLHSKIRANGGKIYMNPSQITLYNSHYLCQSLE